MLVEIARILSLIVMIGAFMAYVFLDVLAGELNPAMSRRGWESSIAYFQWFAAGFVVFLIAGRFDKKRKRK